MPICLSQKHHFRGIFSQREIVWKSIKTLEGIDENGDEELTNKFLISVPNGRIQIGEDCFYSFTYANLCKALRELTRVGIYDKEGANFCYGIWLTPMNEIYYTPTELNEKAQKEDESFQNQAQTDIADNQAEATVEPEPEPEPEPEAQTVNSQ